MGKVSLVMSKPAVTYDEDVDLISAIANGDRAAFRALHRKHHSAVNGFALRMLRAPDRAEEVTNDTFLAVWKGAKKFESRSKVSTWIFGIAYRIAQKSTRRYWFEKSHVGFEDVPEIEDETPDGVEALFTQQRVARALATLPLDLRTVVELTYYYGHSYPEIAEIVGAPVGTIKSRMHAARARLREELQ